MLSLVFKSCTSACDLSKRGFGISLIFVNNIKFVGIGNDWKMRHECLILVLDLKVSKLTRIEASKNNVIIKEYQTYQQTSNSK